MFASASVLVGTPSNERCPWKPYSLSFWSCSCSVAEDGDTVVGAASTVSRKLPILCLQMPFCAKFSDSIA
jgi:hypothetical protein